MCYTNLPDKELVQMYVKGKESALGELIQRHQSKIYTAIFFLTKQESLSDDIFQNTFVKVIHNLRAGKYHEEGRFLSWVMRIAHNLVIDHFRKTNRSPVITTTEGYDIFNVLHFVTESTQDKMMREQSHQDLRSLIACLPDTQREVLVMRYYADLSFKEIAECTNVSINTALGRMRYALNGLRKLMRVRQRSIAS